LKDHCVKNGITHDEFNDFDDVARVLESLLAG
jgi:hypothetical protein